ncbi:hypothetical protein HK099_005824, partial [Clydaea vesicula]
ITTHVLDTTNGVAAKNVELKLEFSATGPNLDTNEFKTLAHGTTDSDGRCSTLLNPSDELKSGIYRLTFLTKNYFDSLNQKTFFPITQITFEVPNPPENHYHVPLLISNYSYSSYRGT